MNKVHNEYVKDIEPTEGLQYVQHILWFNPAILPMRVVGIGDGEPSVIRVPARDMNRYGRAVPVFAFQANAFSGKEFITDIILPSCIEGFPEGAFAGCTNLRRITIPRRVKKIPERAFAGCVNLETIFYEGSLEEWKKVEIVYEKHEIEFGALVPGSPVQSIEAERLLAVPGNEPVFSADIHLGCDLEKSDRTAFVVKACGKDITRWTYGHEEGRERM